MATLIAKPPESDLTEAEAIRQAKDGDAAAFEYLYRANFRRVYSVCLRIIKNPAEAEDLTQQVSFFNLAAPRDCECCFDAPTPEKTD
jgi:DNA-directed RNA polymerase specialized sigma24 family protein